jgi:hypothetical protein
MIISHKHKFVFIKTAKTGGSTIEKILCEHLGDKDIASGSAYKDSTSISPTMKRNFPIKMDYPDELGGYSHLPASLIYEKFFAGRRPEDYFVFTIERNSYDKAVSHWWWHTYAKRLLKQMNPTGVNFREHLTRLLRDPHNNHPSCWHRYADEGICVDHVYQYAEWEEMFKDLSKRFNLEIDMNSTRSIKLKDSNKPFSNYREAYKNNEQELVEQLFVQEIKHFNYKF